MTPQARLRRIGWLALMAVCTALYGVLHFQVWSVASEVKKAERRIVMLEQGNQLRETEFLTRSSQVQLAAWNRVDFGYSAPRADQFIDGERQLAQFAPARAGDMPEPIRLAGFNAEEEAEPFPQLVSPITGKPVDVALVDPAADAEGGRVILSAASGAGGEPVRVPLSSRSATGAVVRIALGGVRP